LARLLLPFPIGVQQTYSGFPDVLYFHKPNSRGNEISPYREFSPNLVRYDNHGFRGDLQSLNSNSRLVVLMGDSFVEARQVSEEKSLTGQLANKFKNLNFINSGCSAYTTTTEYLLLKNRIIKFQPEQIILFFSFNDYSDNYIYKGGYFRHPSIFSEKVPPAELVQKFENNDKFNSFSEFGEFIRRHSALAANLALFINNRNINYIQKIHTEKAFKSTFLEVNTPTEKMDYEGRKVLEFTHRGLSEMGKLANQHGIDFSVYIIPLPTQVGSKEWSSGKSLFYGYDPDSIENSRLYQSRLMKFCKTTGIRCIDLLPDFRKAYGTGKGPKLFFDYDGHWTPEGHRIVANAVAKQLLIN
jgi:hypothetical protein